jgi:hypothetical protein
VVQQYCKLVRFHGADLVFTDAEGTAEIMAGAAGWLLEFADDESSLV